MENKLVKAIHRSHPERIGPHIVDLDEEMPLPLLLHQAAIRLRNLHLPDSGGSSTGTYLSRFEGTRWLSYVSKTLEVASQAATMISEQNVTVVLQEGSGRDSACVISSLIEVLCDPYARTIRGLHATIAKHWVALGHPFTTRLGHTRQDKQQQGPCFLLFLDCVHQLCVQQPHLLEYTPQYLAALWSAAYCPLYTTFLFNSTNNRHSTINVLKRESRNSCVELWDIWNWWSSCKSQAPTIQPPPSNTNRRGSKLPKNNSISSDKSNGSSTVTSKSDIKGVKLKTFPIEKPSEDCDSQSSVVLNVLTNDSKSVSSSRNSDPNTSNNSTSVRECTKSCRVARRSFLSPLYVHQLFLSLLLPGAIDRIRDPLSVAHHTWDQIRRLLFPQQTSHLPYNTSNPPIYPQLFANDHRPPSKSQLPAPLELDSSIPRLEPWVGLFAQWLPEESYSISGGSSNGDRKLTLPENPHLLFWEIIYEMYDTVDNYLNQPSCSHTATINGLKF
uniref:Myotubularin-related protein 10-A-like n=1 Tax=Hirondellea gigas TaxID=1518452 RepID=A0A6A7G4E4_9CRUS